MDLCIPDSTDWSCKYPTEAALEAAREDEVTGPLIEKAEAFAWSLLAALTNYRIGTCPITVRPCAARCAPPGSYRVAPVGRGSTGVLGVGTIGMLNPYISGGRWLNACGCGSGDCGCTALSEIILPGPVGRIVSVYIDGDLIPNTDYRVDNGNRLVRLDGESWPACQDMAASDHDGFSVTYYRGAAPNAMTRAAAGALAAEFLAACSGEECRLPGSVVRASRGGESYEFAPQDFANGDTGIVEVNAVIRIYNPANLKYPIIVASPDSYDVRVPSWGRS